MQNKHKLLEAMNFIGKKGILYCLHYATNEERQYWKNILYWENGIPILSAFDDLISHRVSVDAV